MPRVLGIGLGAPSYTGAPGAQLPAGDCVAVPDRFVHFRSASFLLDGSTAFTILTFRSCISFVALFIWEFGAFST
jgi:hypothetical protein